MAAEIMAGRISIKALSRISRPDKKTKRHALVSWVKEGFAEQAGASDRTGEEEMFRAEDRSSLCRQKINFNKSALVILVYVNTNAVFC